MNMMDFLLNEVRILILRAALTRALDKPPHDLQGIFAMLDKLHAARVRRPAGFTSWLEARRLERVRKS